MSKKRSKSPRVATANNVRRNPKKNNPDKKIKQILDSVVETKSQKQATTIVNAIKEKIDSLFKDIDLRLLDTANHLLGEVSKLIDEKLDNLSSEDLNSIKTEIINKIQSLSEEQKVQTAQQVSEKLETQKQVTVQDVVEPSSSDELQPITPEQFIELLSQYFSNKQKIKELYDSLQENSDIGNEAKKLELQMANLDQMMILTQIKNAKVIEKMQGSMTKLDENIINGFKESFKKFDEDIINPTIKPYKPYDQDVITPEIKPFSESESRRVADHRQTTRMSSPRVSPAQLSAPSPGTDAIRRRENQTRRMNETISSEQRHKEINKGLNTINKKLDSHSGFFSRLFKLNKDKKKEPVKVKKSKGWLLSALGIAGALFLVFMFWGILKKIFFASAIWHAINIVIKIIKSARILYRLARRKIYRFIAKIEKLFLAIKNSKFGRLVSRILRPVIDFFTKVKLRFLNLFKEGGKLAKIGKLFGWISRLFGRVGKVAGWVTRIFGRIIKFAKWGLKIVKPLFKYVGKFLKFVMRFLRLIPFFGKFIPIIGWLFTLWDVITLIIKYWGQPQKLKDDFINLITVTIPNWLKTELPKLAKKVWDWICFGAKWLWDNVLANKDFWLGIWDILKALFVGSAKVIGILLGFCWDAISWILGKIWDGICFVGQWIMKGFFEFLDWVGEKLWNIGSMIWDKIVEFGKWIGDKIYDNVLEFGIFLGNQLNDFIKWCGEKYDEFVNWVADCVNSIIQTCVTKYDEFVNWIADIANSIIQTIADIKDKAKKGFEAAVEFFVNLPDMAKNKIKDVLSSLLNMLQNLLSSLWNSLVDCTISLLDKIPFTGSAIDWLKEKKVDIPESNGMLIQTSSSTGDSFNMQGKSNLSYPDFNFDMNSPDLTGLEDGLGDVTDIVKKQNEEQNKKMQKMMDMTERIDSVLNSVDQKMNNRNSNVNNVAVVQFNQKNPSMTFNPNM